MLPITLQTTSDLETLRESCELECKLAAGQDGKVSLNLLTNESARTLEIDGHTLIAVEIPRASRRQRPVYLDGNPLGGHCYRRLHEGDQRMSDDDVKLMLAEQQHDSLDDELLPYHTMADLDSGTLKIYRQTHTNLNPGHVWSGFHDVEFLKVIGSWKRDRETRREGLTKAGLLMFGSHRSIREALANGACPRRLPGPGEDLRREAAGHVRLPEPGPDAHPDRNGGGRV